ncbi:DMT family transporter [Candidatus Lokiarchaeum ossiferum]
MNKNTKKGLMFGAFGVIAESFLPVVTNLRPDALDAFYFAWFTMIFESIFIFPLMIAERKKFKNKLYLMENATELETKLSRNQIILSNIIIGIIFAVALIIQFYALPIAGAILSSIVLKSSLIFSMLIGVVLLHEKVTKQQLVFTLTLLFGLFFTLTNGFAAVVEMNIGAIMLFFLPLLWMFGHYFTKKLMDVQKSPPMTIVISRTAIGSLVLGIFYVIAFPDRSIFILLDLQNLLSLLLAGVVYSIIHICWYKVLQYMDLSKSTTIYALTPIVTSIFALIILNEKFTVIHLIGITVVIISILFFYREHPKKENND